MKKQNLNIGDKLLCREGIHIKEFTYFYANKSYNIGFIEIRNDDYCYYITDENDRYYRFSINSDYLYSHFYTKKEERKIKLNKLINEKTES